MNKKNGRGILPLKLSDLNDDMKIQPDLCAGFERGELSKNRRIRPIKWGDEFKEWPLPRQLKRAMDMAASINDALDQMQIERNKLLLVASTQEAQIKKLLGAQERTNALLLSQMTQSNELSESRIKEIQELKAEIRELKKI